MNRVKKNTGKHSIYNGQKKIKYLGINSTKEVKDIYNDKYTSLKKEIKEDIKRCRDLKRIIDQKNQYYENGDTTKSNLFVQCNSHQNSKDILHRDRKINKKFIWKNKGLSFEVSNIQSNPEQKVQCWRYHNI
jgi:hypothetical protein